MSLVPVTYSSQYVSIKKYCFNLFLPDDPIIYFLKTPGNQRFSGVFMRYKTGTLDNGNIG